MQQLVGEQDTAGAAADDDHVPPARTRHAITLPITSRNPAIRTHFLNLIISGIANDVWEHCALLKTEYLS